MRPHILIDRPTRQFRIARRAAHLTGAPRKIIKSNLAVPTARQRVERNYSPPSPGFQCDPYLDYGRYMTREGGILIVYKDIDVRLRHTLWRLLVWSLFTGLAALYLYPYTYPEVQWINIAAFLAIAVINWFIVKKPVELYRRIEIRPDCMIVEGSDVFWARFIENGFPNFHADKDGNQVLSGTYGTRYVEFLTVRRFDEQDRMPQVFAAHLQDAMRQQV